MEIGLRGSYSNNGIISNGCGVSVKPIKAVVAIGGAIVLVFLTAVGVGLVPNPTLVTPSVMPIAPLEL